VDTYERRPPGATRAEGAQTADEIVNDTSALLRLIPFPGSEALSPLALLPLRAMPGTEPTPIASRVPDIVGQPAASIVSQAASILDDEMAKGVLAARRSADAAPRAPSYAGNPLLREVHDLVDRIADILPRMQGGAAQAGAAGPVPELRPAAAARPGQRATISMTLCNREDRPVRLVPTATDLLGSRGGRIACTRVEFTASEFDLAPQERSDLTFAILVPELAEADCYSGLLVVKGAEYVRALITLEVA